MTSSPDAKLATLVATTKEDNTMFTSLANKSSATTHRTSLHNGCVETVFSAMDYIPWDNPHNLVTAEVESLSRRIKDNLLIFLFLIGGPGNVINMAVFYKQGLKERVNVCLFALALADELYLLTVMLFNGEQIHVQFTTKEKIGPLRTFLTNSHVTGLMGFSYVSAVLSATIATERCHCILRPLTYHSLMRARTMAAIIAVVYVMVIGLYFLVAGFRFRYGCLYDPVTGEITKATFLETFYVTHKEFLDVTHSVVFGIGLPGLTIAVVAVTTIITAFKLRQIVTWRAETSVSISAREVALTKMLIATSIMFIVCIVPSALSRNTSLIFPEMNVGRHYHNFFLTTVWIGQSFLFINSSFNIFVYYIMGSRYRQTLWTLLGRRPKPK